MAKTSKKAAPKGKGGGGLIGFILVTLVAIGAGAGFGMFLYGSLFSEPEEVKLAAKKKKKADVPEPKPLDNTKLVTLTPVIAELPDSDNTWLRIEASVVVDATTVGESVVAAEVAADIAAYLRSTTLVQLEGPSGYINLRQDLVDRARIRAPGKVKDLVIHGMVLE